MQDSMYSAMFGALTQEHRMNSIANNLANVNTTGYKKDVLVFKDVFIRFAHDVIMEPIMNIRSKKLFPEPMHIAKPRLGLSQIDFTQGGMHYTGNPLDVAIAGDGFFKFNTGNGEYYSRNGNFHITSEGTLVTAQGYTVLGDGGDIVIPPGVKNVHIDSTGRIFADNEMVGRVLITGIEDPTQLEKHAYNMFKGRPGVEPVEVELENPQLEQGYLETANVNVVEEMVNMIETQRAFEAYQKVIQGTQETDQRLMEKVAVFR